jgi:hypothetical protein
MLVLAIMALADPCKRREKIREFPEKDIAQINEDTAKKTLPRRNIFLRPTISANLPNGTKKTAEAIKNDMVIQLRLTAPIENSIPILGKATLTAAPIKGLKKFEVIVTANSTVLLTWFSFFISIFDHELLGKQMIQR